MPPKPPAKPTKNRVSYRSLADDTLRLIPSEAVKLRTRKMQLRDDGDVSLLNHLHTSLSNIMSDASTYGPEFIQRTTELRTRHAEVEKAYNDAPLTGRAALRARADVLKDSLAIATGFVDRIAPHFEKPTEEPAPEAPAESAETTETETKS